MSDSVDHKECREGKGCKECKKLQQKLNIYKKFIEDIKEIDHLDQNISLEESIIIEQDTEGHYNKKVPSDLNESFLVIESAKNINELNKSELRSIKFQDDFYKYDQVKKCTEGGGVIYNITYYVLGATKLFATVL
jgi:hypothetical protein